MLVSQPASPKPANRLLSAETKNSIIALLGSADSLAKLLRIALSIYLENSIEYVVVARGQFNQPPQLYVLSIASSTYWFYTSWIHSQSVKPENANWNDKHTRVSWQKGHSRDISIHLWTNNFWHPNTHIRTYVRLKMSLFLCFVLLYFCQLC